jgi:phosphoserine phosphatase
LYDFDGTLIEKMIGALMPIVSDRAMPREAEQEIVGLRKTYVDLFLAGRITEAEYRTWLIEEIVLFVRYGLKADAWRSALQHVRLRQGVPELIRDLHDLGVRQAIVSGAIADFVEYVLEVNGVLDKIDAVYAARLMHDDTGVVVGHDPKTIVHPGNKGDWSLDFAYRFGLDPQLLIGVGDSIGDVNLGNHAEHRIGVAETEVQAAMLRSFGTMGEVISLTDHFNPISAAIKRRLGIPII